ncbi:uncharacterized protein LOC122375696 [Amphibalanus amphitrite]|uniref:uncharacterized protein LOC122375696 n=1 Tax=Amphibalanus amphitrite TaxID=1232801 RepID=UPI001C903E24|nr:uncharacterized protein LOC122375696 [Amphibalanus amphitrite]
METGEDGAARELRGAARRPAAPAHLTAGRGLQRERQPNRRGRRAQGTAPGRVEPRPAPAELCRRGAGRSAPPVPASGSAAARRLGLQTGRVCARVRPAAVSHQRRHHHRRPAARLSDGPLHLHMIGAGVTGPPGPGTTRLPPYRRRGRVESDPEESAPEAGTFCPRPAAGKQPTALMTTRCTVCLKTMSPALALPR